jgi:hypothetical protein
MLPIFVHETTSDHDQMHENQIDVDRDNEKSATSTARPWPIMRFPPNASPEV